MKPTQRDFLKSLIGAATIGAALLTTQPVLAKSAETLVPSTGNPPIYRGIYE